jgi:FdhD protein
MKTTIVTVPIHKIEDGCTTADQDFVAVEEPLQIRLADKDLLVTMRTPGHDRDLAAGFLFTEGLLQHPSQIANIHEDGRGTITITLAPGVEIDKDSLVRSFYRTSSCGVCGKASIDALRIAGSRSLPYGEPLIDPGSLFDLPNELRRVQPIFERTGGLHAAGLFNAEGKVLSTREDVGRHNAVDKLIGAAFLENRVPLSGHILMLSGRVSFELVQKAVMAGIPVIAAIGAPSSLAIATARRFNLTLVGFLRDRRFNVYAGEPRLRNFTSLQPQP